MKRNDLDPFITEPDDEPDTTKCQACSEPFGLELGQVRRAAGYPELCTECVDDFNRASSTDRDYDAPEPGDDFDSPWDVQGAA